MRTNNNKHAGPAIGHKDNFQVIECQACKFKHIVPIPSGKELNQLYTEDFYSTEKPDYFKYAEEDLDWWMATYKAYYLLLGKHTDGKKLLDIGSGPGYFLKCGKEFGWEVMGIEPSKRACEYSRKLGVSVENAFFDKQKANNLSGFDVVYMNAVLEHVPDPVSLIRNARRVLRQDGLVCVVSPNEYNPLQVTLKEQLGFNSWWVAPPQHINYFDFDSIRNLLARSGFEIVDAVATFPMEAFLLSGENYIGNDVVGRKCHAARKKFELNMYKHNSKLLLDFYRFLASKKIGREFIILGRKITNETK